MSKVEEIIVSRSEFDELTDRVDRLETTVEKGFRKVEDEFIDVRRNQSRMETSIMELRREQAHHSDLLGEVIKRQDRLEQNQEGLRQESAETRNMVKQILEIISKK